MASPFRYFRKHSKGLMAALVVLCMGLFVFSSGSGGSNGRDPESNAKSLVATWNGGSMNQGELAARVSQRLIVDEFLRRLFQEGGGEPGRTPLPFSVPNLLLQSRDTDYVEQRVVESEVLASLARDAGITVSDELINHYIKEFGLRNVDNQKIHAILGSMGQDSALANEARVFDGLRRLLQEHFYTSWWLTDGRRFPDGVVVPPLEKWNDWRRVNDRISLTAAVLPVDDFLKDVPEPSDEQLEALYNDFKDKEPGQQLNVLGRPMPSPDPGFREPRRVAMQYVLGDLVALAYKLKDEISDEDVKTYYEEHKDTEFLKSDFLLDDLPDQEKTEAEKAQNEGAGLLNPSNAAGSEASPAEPAPPAQEPQDDAGDKAAEDKATEDKATEGEPGEPGKDDSSANPKPSPFRLAAYQTPTSDTPPADSAADEQQTDPPATADADAETKSHDSAAEDIPAADEAESKPAAETDYEPLGKVEDDIRMRLATEKAMKLLDQQFGEIAAQLQTQYNRYASQIAAAQELKEKLPDPPAKLADLKWLTEKYSLKFEKLAPLTAQELSETPLGRAGDLQSGRMVLQSAFGGGQSYEPILARDLAGNFYLAVKSEEIPERTPPFSEVRDKVLAAWKHREAAKLAEKKAQELAAEAEKSDLSFEEFFANKGWKLVNQTENFSWRSYPAGPGQGSPPILSQVPELKNAGVDFMEKAFELEGNETAGLLNFDQSEAFVIRLHSRQYSPEDLRALFLDEVASWPGQREMLLEHMRSFVLAAYHDVVETRGGLKYDEGWLERRAKQRTERE